MQLTFTPHVGRGKLAALGLAAALLAAPLAAGFATPAVAAPATAPVVDPAAGQYLGAQVNDLIDVRIGDVRPTQPSVGYDEIFYKLGRYDAELGKDALNKRFGDWCEANGQLDVVAVPAGATLHDPASFSCEVGLGSETPASIAAMKTVVIGPGGVPYLTDGHHTLTSFAETPDGGQDLHVRLRVTANLSAQDPELFWQTMAAQGWTWLERPDGSTITPAQLPTSIALRNFSDDARRSLLYFARDIGFAAGTIPFQEFYWGAWLRESNPAYLTSWDRDDLASYLATVRALSEDQVTLQRDAVLFGGFTAAELGALTEWNDGKKESKGEWNKLSQPYTAEKPGKLAYALAYKEAHPWSEEPGGEDGGETPVDPTTVFGTLSASGQFIAGERITVTGTSFAASTAGFALELHSDPVSLASVSTDAAGAFSVDVQLPADATGSHSLVLLVHGVSVGSMPVSIAPASIKPPVTGPTNPGPNEGKPESTKPTDSQANSAGKTALAATGAPEQPLLPAAGVIVVLLIAGATTLVLRRAQQ